jgi:hypothetical protein
MSDRQVAMVSKMYCSPDVSRANANGITHGGGVTLRLPHRIELL